MPRCGARHPEDPSRVCITEPTFADHTDGEVTWPNVEVQERMRIKREQKAGGKSKGKRRSGLVAIAAAVEANRRTFNGVSQEEGMALAETSEASADFRTRFCVLMAGLATRKEYLTTNDVWDLWEAQGLDRPESKQAAGIAGRALVKIGVLTATTDTDTNTSGNGHSTDNGVRVWRSLVVGLPTEEVQSLVMAEMAANDKSEVP